MTENLKVLHRIYFGFDGKPDPYLEYLKTWEEQLPSYTIKYWGKDNLPLDINEYTRALYKEKDHAYLSDYFRWWVLREYGGIYLDADIEVTNGEKFNELVEALENTSDYDAFIAVEDFDGLNYTAHSMACRKGASIAVFVCKLYENMGALYHLRCMPYSPFAAPRLAKLYFMESLQDGIQDFERPSVDSRVMIYPKDYFSPLGVSQIVSHSNKTYSMFFCLKNYSGNTCLCHHFSSSWVKERANKHHLMLYRDYLNQANKKGLSLFKQIIKTKSQNIFHAQGIKKSFKMIIKGSVSLTLSLINKGLEIIGIGKKF